MERSCLISEKEFYVILCLGSIYIVVVSLSIEINFHLNQSSINLADHSGLAV
jgi:hypothetical protein